MRHSTTHFPKIRKRHFGALVVVLLAAVAAICLPSRAAAASALAPQPEGTPLVGHVPAHTPEAFEPRSRESAKVRARPLPLLYHGGPTQDYTRTYVIFWLPPGYTFDETGGGSSYYEGLITRYLTDINASTFYNTVTQYGDTSRWIRPSSDLADVVLDTTPYPTRSGHVFTIDSDIQAEVVKWIRARGWYYGPHEQFLVYTAAGLPTWHPDLGWSDDPRDGYCAYHNYFSYNFGTGNYPIMYANMPDPEGQYGCYAAVAVGKGKARHAVALSPNGDPVADSVVSITSHEQFETVTDPQLNAWKDANGSEVADKCLGLFGPLAADGGNVTLNGHRYVLQGEWSNALVSRFGGGCSWFTAVPFHGQ